MAWTGQTFNVGQILTAAQMNNLQNDLTALANGDLGAPLIAEAAMGADVTRWKVIESQDISTDALIDFISSIDSTYDLYRFRFKDLVGDTVGASLNLRVSEDTGSTFKSGATDYGFHVAEQAINSTSYVASSSTGTNRASFISSIGTGGTRKVNGMLYLFNPSNTDTAKLFKGLFGYDKFGVAKQASDSTIFYQGTVNAIDAVRFFMSSGNLLSGNITLEAMVK